MDDYAWWYMIEEMEREVKEEKKAEKELECPRCKSNLVEDRWLLMKKGIRYKCLVCKCEFGETI